MQAIVAGVLIHFKQSEEEIQPIRRLRKDNTVANPAWSEPPPSTTDADGHEVPDDIVQQTRTYATIEDRAYEEVGPTQQPPTTYEDPSATHEQAYDMGLSPSASEERTKARLARTSAILEMSKKSSNESTTPPRRKLRADQPAYDSVDGGRPSETVIDLSGYEQAPTRGRSNTSDYDALEGGHSMYAASHPSQQQQQQQSEFEGFDIDGEFEI